MVSTIVPFNMVGLELSVSLDQCEPLKALYETVLPLTDILPSSVQLFKNSTLMYHHQNLYLKKEST